MDNNPTDGSLSWQEQRQEAIRLQQERWRQLHPEQQQQQQPDHPMQPQPYEQQQQHSPYPPIPPAHAAGPLVHYPDVPAPSAPPLDFTEHPSAADADRLRRQQQEEEDHRLAMQLAEQFAAEDEAQEDEPAGVSTHHQGLYDTPMAWEGLGSDDADEWEAIARTTSMGQIGAGQGPMGQQAAAAARPTSQAAAAAGSTAGSVIGAGLSALLAMAAQAAANRAQQAAAAGGDAAGTGDARASQGSSAAAAGQHAAGSPATAQHTAAAAGGSGGGGSSSGGSGGEGGGVLSMAANALRSFLASRAAGNQAGSSAAAGAGSAGHQGGEGRRWEDEQPAPEDLEMLQNMMQTLMGGNLPPGINPTRNQPQVATATAAAGTQAGSTAPGSGNSGFRVTRLPGGGFSATYSSSSGPGSSSSWQVHSSTSHSSGSGDPFAGMMGGGGGPDAMFGGPDDFLSQLLLAGARSARDNSGRAGYTHYDPRSGDAHFEPMGGAGGAAGMGLEALLSQLMGPGLFGGGGGGMSYEDLVGLSDVQVTTPEEVLSSLPQSKFVEGRRPGDSDTCVICQTTYSVGDDLTHLPCLHAFHKDCIAPWLSGHSRKCPVCKTDVC